MTKQRAAPRTQQGSCFQPGLHLRIMRGALKIHDAMPSPLTSEIRIPEAGAKSLEFE